MNKPNMDTTDTTGSYEGPACIHLSKDEWLTVWQNLERIPLQENAEIRKKIKRYLEWKNESVGG